jgi:hypothetical protein
MRLFPFGNAPGITITLVHRIASSSNRRCLCTCEKKGRKGQKTVVFSTALSSFLNPLADSGSLQRLLAVEIIIKLLLPPRVGNTYPNLRHEATKALKSCGTTCAVWGEDLLRHYGVPTIIFDHFW